ncbi:MAG: hypothetical protein FJZ64_04355 [Chlamydiae bacterium]|nr:hypothetical protein [Chlamydiota bacterium]
MKNLAIILAVFSLGSTPILPKGAAQSVVIGQPANSFRSGLDAVTSVRKSFDKGEYNTFLKEMDSLYIAAKEGGELDQIANMRTGFSEDWQQWEAKAQTLQQEKNQELLKAVADQKTPFAQKIRSVTTELSDTSEHKAINHLASFRQMAPNTGKNSDENRLIDIDLEYEYKALELNDPKPQEKREKLCALQMAKFEKIREVSREFKDESLKKEIDLMGPHFDTRLAQKWDLADLNALANGKIVPKDAVEEKIASILSHYQEKLSDLTKHFVAEQDKK